MRVKPQIQLETFSKVVEAVYDCALDPTHWQHTIRLIADLCRSQTCILGVYDYANGHSELAFQLGYTERFIRLHNEKYKHMDPHFAAGQLVPVGTVMTQVMLIDDEEFYQSRFYQEWCKPQRLHDFMGFKVLQTEQRIGFLSTNRCNTHPRYGKDDIRLLSLLAPHVCRAVIISDALNLKTIRSEALKTALDALTSGIYLVDRLGRVIYMNRAANRQVERGDAVLIANGRLAPFDRRTCAALTGAIRQAIANEAATPASGFSIALPAREGAGLVAAVLPLTRGERQNVCGAFAAMAAIFVQDPIVVPPFPGEAFAKLHGLTGSELRVLLAMAPGLSVKEAAEVLGVSETTAKTHLQHIYNKTGTSKQTELMQLFKSSSPPVKAA
jgi:DNA-binding CsgD family transcriptional regulator/PAS domain-containing protein